MLIVIRHSLKTSKTRENITIYETSQILQDKYHNKIVILTIPNADSTFAVAVFPDFLYFLSHAAFPNGDTNVLLHQMGSL
jgi:hypothetical protein